MEVKQNSGNARQINVNAVNAMKRQTRPSPANNSPARNKTATEAAASRPPKRK
jgi:hypothetical protein